MSKIKQSLIVFALLVLLVTNIHSLSYAAPVPVTKDNLNNALQSFSSSDFNQKQGEISVSNENIQITSESNSYTMNYNLANNPTFTCSIPISQGMSYDEFQDQLENLYLPMIGYIGVANVQGVDFESATFYIGMQLLSGIMPQDSSLSPKYVIIDDGVSASYEDGIVIYKSDFGNHVMEYVNSYYSTPLNISDNTDGYNTFTWTIEQTDVTSTSCNLVSTLSVNLDSDFSQINELANSSPEETELENDDTFDLSSNFDDLEYNNDNGNNDTYSNLIRETTTAKTTLPKAGFSKTIIIMLILLLFISILSGFALKKYDITK